MHSLMKIISIIFGIRMKQRKNLQKECKNIRNFGNELKIGTQMDYDEYRQMMDRICISTFKFKTDQELMEALNDQAFNQIAERIAEERIRGTKREKVSDA